MRKMSSIGKCFALLALIALVSCGPSANQLDSNDWPVYGGSNDENHYSTLTDITADNVSKLRLAWYADLDSPWSSSAPIEAGGVLYTATGLSIVQAFDVETGRQLWTYDPKVSETTNKVRLQAPHWGIRGLAFADGRLYVATLDGRLIALKASNGSLVWEKQTLDPKTPSSYITGVPRVFDGKVIIGFAGADVGTTRGYVTAYDAKTGKQLWRFWTVPGNPADGFEDEAMKKASKTWTGEWWRYGGGGTVWNAMTYDAKFNRIYLGTGNGQTWNRKIRSPGGGDNLFLSSIVALDADTGKYVWHYQNTPGDTWDFNASMDIELTELEIGGKKVPVILNAPKNGFFYVIDRRNGRLISAHPFSKVTWAKGVDMKTGRPIEAENARFEKGAFLVYPGPSGAHSWLPMSFSPKTGLTYIPEITMPAPMSDIPNLQNYKPQTGVNLSAGVDFNTMPATKGPIEIGGSLIAWNATKGAPAWKVPMSSPFSGGVISTAGNLVFHGQLEGFFVAYAADSGRELWRFNANGPLITPPITYSHNGRQYVTIITGIAGSAGVNGEMITRLGWNYRTYPRRILTFALDGKATLPAPITAPPLIAFDDPTYKPDPLLEGKGAAIYHARSCAACHGPQAVSGATGPELRSSSVVADGAAFGAVVQQGVLASRGMPMFHDLSDRDTLALRQYLRSRADTLRKTNLQSR
jgi:quinohemoprotein ethanol dehydrogenase